MASDNPQSRIAVVYYSSTGTVFDLAKLIVAGAEEMGADVRLRRVAETAPKDVVNEHKEWRDHLAATEHIPVATREDLSWAQGIIFGTPARFGNIAGQLKQFFDTLSGLWVNDLLVDKLYSGFTATASEHGGQETTLLALYNSIYHFGGLIVSPGYKGHRHDTGNNPYGTSHVAGEDESIPIDHISRDEARHQGRRVAKLAAALTSGLSVAPRADE